MTQPSVCVTERPELNALRQRPPKASATGRNPPSQHAVPRSVRCSGSRPRSPIAPTSDVHVGRTQTGALGYRHAASQAAETPASAKPERSRRPGCGRSGLLVWVRGQPERQYPARTPDGWVGRTHCWVRPPEEPDLRLSPHPARAGPSGLITRGRTIRSCGEMGSSAGPLTATVVAASSLSVGWGVVVTLFFGVHLTTSARFRARAPGPVSGRLSAAISRRVPICPPWFPAAFRPPALASWSSCARPGVGLSSRSAYRT
jgi:hypothetical protein